MQCQLTLEQPKNYDLFVEKQSFCRFYTRFFTGGWRLLGYSKQGQIACKPHPSREGSGDITCPEIDSCGFWQLHVADYPQHLCSKSQ